jgi:hypothetical protein
VARSQAEVIGLHEFLADWFNDALPNTDAVFARFTSVLHPDFSMVVPSGEILDRDTVLGLVRAAHASATNTAPVRIEIRDLVERVVGDGVVFVTYEEWQFAGQHLQNGRTSTACFGPAPAAPNGVVWRHLHETMLASD